MKRPVLFWSCLVGFAILAVLSYTQIRSNPQACHLLHLVSPPRDLLRPIILDRNTLQAKRERYEFTFRPEYCEIYELGFLADIAPIPQSFNPGVRVRAQVISNAGDVIAEIDRTKPVRISHATSGHGAGKISYGSFGVSLSDEPMTVVLEISGADESHVEPTASLDFFVAVSGSP